MLLDGFRLDERVGLILGGGRGLGRAIAEAYAEVGAELVIAGRTESELHQTAAAIEHLYGHRCMPVVADITNPEHQTRIIQTLLDRFNRVDILVNAAGVGHPGQDPLRPPPGREFIHTQPDDWSAVTARILDDAASMMRLAAQQMIHLGGGIIISVTSAAGAQATDGFSAYGAANVALEHLTRTLAHELGPHGIRVNCIAPGRIVTREQANGPYWTAERRAHVGEAIALGRVGEEDDVAPLAVFLASDASDFITGVTIAVDGGGERLPAPSPAA